MQNQKIKETTARAVSGDFGQKSGGIELYLKRIFALMFGAVGVTAIAASASGTTVLGMVPLLFDSLFRSMAATIMGGLVVATLLVLLLLPTVYSLIYRIKQ